MRGSIGIHYTKLFISSCLHNYNNVKVSYTNNIIERMIQTLSNKAVIPTEQQKLAIISIKHAQKVTTKKDAIMKLQKMFNISLNEAKEMFKEQNKVKKCNLKTLEENYNICINNGLTKKTLKSYPVILTLDDIEERLNYLNKLSIDINILAPILLLDGQTLKRIVSDSKSEENDVPHGNRIIYISKLLNLPAVDVCEKIVDHLFILRMPLNRLKNTLKVLLDYGIEPNNIINDCWALRYSSTVAEERLKRAMEADVSKVKTWMIRCPNSVFERCINRQVENRKILGSNSTVEEYLSERLECSLANAKYLTEKNPALLKMNILKMKEILDYLYDVGYTSTHVCRVPRILIHSLETTKQRTQQLKQLGYVPPSLAVLCKSKRDFDKTLKRYKKLKKIADEKQAKTGIREN